MYTVIGFERKQGIYNEKPYDNTIIYCVGDIDPNKGEGQFAFNIKIKTANLESCPEIGEVITPLYDRYGNCIKI